MDRFALKKSAKSPPEPAVKKDAVRQGVDARAAAVNMLDVVLRKGTSLDDALVQSRSMAALEPRDRAFARMMVATVLRRLGQIDAVLDAFVENPLPDRAFAVRNILRLGVAQLLVLETPAHAVVDNSVRLCIVVRQQGFKGLVNAVLRRVSRDGAVIFAKADPALNAPKWLRESWTKSYGAEKTVAIAKAHLAEPPLDLTVRGNPEEWAKRLGGEVLPGGTVRLRGAGEVTGLVGFKGGGWWVQDAAASVPARLLLSALGDAAGKKIIDLCAAPGGKTAQLLAAGATVTALDRSEQRLGRLRENFDRLGMKAEVVAADATSWRPAQPADAVLLDAPCSATGTIRRHPDIAWNKAPEDVTRLASLQARLLDSAAKMLKPGGVLVYSVCSLQAEEGPDRIASFLAAHKRFERVPAMAAEAGVPEGAVTPDGDIRTLPCHLGDRGGMDGFFIAQLRKAVGR